MEIFLSKEGKDWRDTDPMKVCAMAVWSRGKRFGFWKICGRMVPVQHRAFGALSCFQTPINSAICSRPPAGHAVD